MLLRNGPTVTRQANAGRRIPAVEMVFLSSEQFAAVRAAARRADLRLWANTLTSVGVISILGQGGDMLYGTHKRYGAA